MIAIMVWFLELLLMGILALVYPDSLYWDSMIAGMAYAVLAWIPAFMAQQMK